MTANISINRCPFPVLGHHPFLVCRNTRGPWWARSSSGSWRHPPPRAGRWWAPGRARWGHSTPSTPGPPQLHQTASGPSARVQWAVTDHGTTPCRHIRVRIKAILTTKEARLFQQKVGSRAFHPKKFFCSGSRRRWSKWVDYDPRILWDCKSFLSKNLNSPRHNSISSRTRDPSPIPGQHPAVITRRPPIPPKYRPLVPERKSSLDRCGPNFPNCADNNNYPRRSFNEKTPTNGNIICDQQQVIKLNVGRLKDHQSLLLRMG